MKNNTMYSIVIPVYGTAKSLLELANRIKNVFTKMPGQSYELIFVNDNSPSGDTESTLQSIYENDKSVSVISLSKNFGQQAATLCGIHHAKGEFIITMDDDLQHLPEDIPLLIEHKSHDVVIASFPDKKHHFFKRFTSYLKGWFDHIILKKPRKLKLTAFRLIRRQICQGLKESHTPYPFIPAMLFRITSDIINVEVQHDYRLDGHSNYTIYKMIKIFSNLIINNSYLLLRTIGILGFVGFVFSLIFSIYLLIRHYVWGFAVMGWASLILSVVFFGGLILFALGVIGEYLVRILINLEQKQTYYIKNILKHT